MSRIRDGVIADGDVALACWRERRRHPLALQDLRDIINGHEALDAAYIGATIQRSEGVKSGEFECWLSDGMPEIEPWPA